MAFEDVVKLAGNYIVARIMERDDFETRFENKTSTGAHVFLYPLMQGYDSIAIHADIDLAEAGKLIKEDKIKNLIFF